MFPPFQCFYVPGVQDGTAEPQVLLTLDIQVTRNEVKEKQKFTQQ